MPEPRFLENADGFGNGKAGDAGNFDLPERFGVCLRSDAEVEKRLFEHVARKRRGGGGTIVHRHVRLIDDDEDGDLRIVHGREAQERADVLVRGDHAVHIHLRRAGLAADAIALDVGVAAAAVGDDVLQKLPHRIRGLLGDGLAAHHGLPPLDDLAVFGAYLRDDVGLHAAFRR